MLLRVLVEEISSKSKDIGDSLKGANEASVSADISLLALPVLTAFINSVLFIYLHIFFRSIGALFEGMLNPRQFNYRLWRQFDPQPMRFAYKAFVL